MDELTIEQTKAYNFLNNKIKHGTAYATNPEHRDKQKLNAMERSGAENIKKICEELFYEYKKKNIDIFNLQRDFEMKYPRSKIDNCLKIAELELDIKVATKGSTITTDFE